MTMTRLEGLSRLDYIKEYAERKEKELAEKRQKIKNLANENIKKLEELKGMCLTRNQSLYQQQGLFDKL